MFYVTFEVMSSFTRKEDAHGDFSRRGYCEHLCSQRHSSPGNIRSGWRSLSWNKSFLKGCILMNDVSETGSELLNQRTDFPWGFQSTWRSPSLSKWDEIQLYLFVIIISLPLSLEYLNLLCWHYEGGLFYYVYFFPRCNKKFLSFFLMWSFL